MNGEDSVQSILPGSRRSKGLRSSKVLWRSRFSEAVTWAVTWANCRQLMSLSLRRFARTCLKGAETYLPPRDLERTRLPVAQIYVRVENERCTFYLLFELWISTLSVWCRTWRRRRWEWALKQIDDELDHRCDSWVIQDSNGMNEGRSPVRSVVVLLWHLCSYLS